MTPPAAPRRAAPAARDPRPSAPGGTLLLVWHGTRQAAGEAEFRELVARVAALAPDVGVTEAFMELCEPEIPEAIGRLAAAGVGEVTVVPCMLLAGSHVRDDIPALLQEAGGTQPEIRIRYGRDLGPDPVLVEVAADRVLEALEDPGHGATPGGSASDPARPAETAVVIAGSGWGDPAANADFLGLARAVAERLADSGQRVAAVEAAFAGIAEPRLPAALEAALRHRTPRILIAPYFLFTGLIQDRVRRQARAFARAHPEVEIRFARHLGPDERIARLLLARYHETSAGA